MIFTLKNGQYNDLVIKTRKK